MGESLTNRTKMKESTVLEEEIDENYEPTEEEIIEYALFLGMDVKTERNLFWIAKESLKAPLPAEWKPCQTSNGSVYYFNFKTGESIWDHPCDEYYRNLYKNEKEKIQMQNIDAKKEVSNSLIQDDDDSDWDKEDKPAAASTIVSYTILPKPQDQAETANHTTKSQNISETLSFKESTEKDQPAAASTIVSDPILPKLQVQAETASHITKSQNLSVTLSFKESTEPSQEVPQFVPEFLPNAPLVIEELNQKNISKLDKIKKELNIQFELEKNRIQSQFRQKLKFFIDEAEEKLATSITNIRSAIRFDQSHMIILDITHTQDGDPFDQAIREGTNRLQWNLQNWSKQYQELEQSLKYDLTRLNTIQERKHTTTENRINLESTVSKEIPISARNLDSLMARIKDEEQLLLQAKQHLIANRNNALPGRQEPTKPPRLEKYEIPHIEPKSSTNQTRTHAIIKEYKQWLVSNNSNS